MECAAGTKVTMLMGVDQLWISKRFTTGVDPFLRPVVDSSNTYVSITLAQQHRIAEIIGSSCLIEAIIAPDSIRPSLLLVRDLHKLDN